jgi:hypothetical protein
MNGKLINLNSFIDDLGVNIPVIMTGKSDSAIIIDYLNSDNRDATAKLSLLFRVSFCIIKF